MRGRVRLCLSLVLALGLQVPPAAAESAPDDVPTVKELLTEQGVGHLRISSAAKAGETVDSRTLSIDEQDYGLSTRDLELAQDFGRDIDTSEILIIELDESGPLAAPPGGKLAKPSLDDTVMQTTSSSTCTWVARTRSYTYLGITRYRYMLRSEWCYDRTRIVGTPFTFATPQTWASWQQSGETITRGWHGAGNTRVDRTHAVGRFKTGSGSPDEASAERGGGPGRREDE